MDMNVATLPKKGLKTRPHNMDMNERDLEKLSKSELIKLLLKQKKSKKVRNHFEVLLIGKNIQKWLQGASKR